MTLRIQAFVLGPLENNVYLISDPDSRTAAVIDPGFGSKKVLEAITENGLRLQAIWITHAHFDHTAGSGVLASTCTPAAPIGLHSLDLDLWKSGGGAAQFGINLPPMPAPTFEFSHNQILLLGAEKLKVLHTPGHSPGHVVFYSESTGTVFCGDLIFKSGIGRTDLDGGDYHALQRSIREQIFTLPGDTRLLPGHGPETTILEEHHNPWCNF